MNELVIYFIKNNLEVMSKFADLRKDLNGDLSLKHREGFVKSNDNIGVLHVKGDKKYLQDFVNRNKHLLKQYNGKIVVA